MKTELTIEQSAHLIELGVDPKLASKEIIENVYQAEYNEPRPRVFKLTDILAIMPKQIPYPKPNRLQILYPFTKVGEIMVRYATFDGAAVETDFIAPELIDALNQLLIWYLTEFKKKEKCPE